MSEEFLDQLICLLADDNEDIVRHALRDIEKQDDSVTTDALESALGYVVDGVLPELVSVLMNRAERAGDDAANATFSRIMSHERPAVRHNLILGSGSKYLTDDIEKLLDLLKNESFPDVLASVLSLIDKPSSSQEVVEEITTLVSHIDSRVRANAVEALDRLSVRPDKEIIEPLLVDSSPRVKANAVKLWWAYDPERMEKTVLEELKSPDVKRQRCALYLLGVLSPFDDVASILVGELSDSNADSRALAAKGLSKLSCSLDYKPLVDAYLQEEQQSIREELEGILCKLAKKGAIKDILDYLFTFISSDEPWGIRRSAANVLSIIGGIDSIPYITSCLEIDDDSLKVAVITGISRIDSPEVVAILNDLADNSSTIVSARALLELCLAGEKPPIEKLMELASSKELPVLRCGAIALSRYGTLDTLSVLVESYRRISGQVIITDEESDVRAELLGAIENIRSREER